MRVSAALKPERCVPPSWVLMLFAKEYIVSLKPSLYWKATSTMYPPISLPTLTISGWIAPFPSFRCSTKSLSPSS